MEGQEVARRQAGAVAETTPKSVDEIVGQVRLIQDVMANVMKEGEHYGVIPGTGNKPSLLQPGAQILALTFRLRPESTQEVFELGNGHREYRTHIKMYGPGGDYLGDGRGEASTMETKWRYRSGPVVETGRPVPQNYWNMRNSDPAQATQLLGGKGFAVSKVDGVWQIVEKGERVEHDNPADYYNTCTKMSYKRALVHATINVTASSDMFTQDAEDLPKAATVAADQPTAAPKKEPQRKAATPQAQEQAANPGLIDKQALQGEMQFVPATYGERQSKEGAKKPWHNYFVTDAAGNQFATFDGNVGGVIKLAHENKEELLVAWERTPKGYINITGADIVDDVPIEDEVVDDDEIPFPDPREPGGSASGGR